MGEAELFRTLADPTRRAVFERLSREEMNVSQLKAGFAVSQPAISQHLAALRAAGLVHERREGRFAYYRARPDGLAPFVDWVARHREFWPGHVDRLKQVLEEMDE